MSSPTMIILYLLYALFSLFFSVSAYSPSQTRALVKSSYSHAHSLSDSYIFDPRDGWFSTNITDLSHNYSHAQRRNFSARDDKSQENTKPKISQSVASSISSLVHKVVSGLKGVGSSKSAILTWYTGKDLLNPSCWSKGDWAPTDQSFACAVTQDGWEGRPQCFDFLEICASDWKCIFVRVVDTCAGCKSGSHHIDLTRGAFTQLADPDKGVLNAKFRLATKPKEYWFEELWGPKN